MYISIPALTPSTSSCVHQDVAVVLSGYAFPHKKSCIVACACWQLVMQYTQFHSTYSTQKTTQPTETVYFLTNSLTTFFVDLLQPSNWQWSVITASGRDINLFFRYKGTQFNLPPGTGCWQRSVITASGRDFNLVFRYEGT